MYILVWKSKHSNLDQFDIVENEADLTKTVERIMKNGKEPKLKMYEAIEKSFVLEYEEKEVVEMVEIPKVRIL